MGYMELGLYTQEFHTSCMTSAVKWVPRSELTLKGSPNLEKMWFNNRQAVVSAVSLGAGKHSLHFMNSQTTVRKYLLPRVDRDPDRARHAESIQAGFGTFFVFTNRAQVGLGLI